MVFVASLDGEREVRRGFGLFEVLGVCAALFELFEFFGLFDLVRERVLRLRGFLQGFGLLDLFGLLEVFGLDFSGLFDSFFGLFDRLSTSSRLSTGRLSIDRLSTERLSTSFVGDLDRD